jgi:hypothetical protein
MVRFLVSEVRCTFSPVEFISESNPTAIPQQIRQQSSGQSHCQRSVRLAMTHVLCEIIGTLGIFLLSQIRY